MRLTRVHDAVRRLEEGHPVRGAGRAFTDADVVDRHVTSRAAGQELAARVRNGGIDVVGMKQLPLFPAGPGHRLVVAVVVGMG